MSYSSNECNKTLFTVFQPLSDLTYLLPYLLPLTSHPSFLIFVNIESG